MKRKNIIISGGGTGGHLYPALTVGRKIKEREPSLRIIFVGSSRNIEKKILEKQGVNFIPLRIEGLKRKGIKIIKSLFLLPPAFIKSLIILFQLKPKMVLGVGGYSSGPIVLLASMIRIPTLILEQNVYPGFTNRLLISRVKRAAVSFESSLPYFKGKAIFTGNPVREDFYTLRPKPRSDKLSILIFGGSQGSHFLNKGVTASLPYLKKEEPNINIFHQTGKNDFEWVKESYKHNDFEEVIISPYFFDIDKYYEKADIVICRAGATTIAELIAAQKASILVPFAKAADNHQVLNAKELEKRHGAEILLEEEFTPQFFAKKILSFQQHKEKIDQMEKNLSSLRKNSAAEDIVGLCFETMECSL